MLIFWGHKSSVKAHKLCQTNTRANPNSKFKSHTPTQSVKAVINVTISNYPAMPLAALTFHTHILCWSHKLCWLAVSLETSKIFSVTSPITKCMLKRHTNGSKRPVSWLKVAIRQVSQRKPCSAIDIECLRHEDWIRSISLQFLHLKIMLKCFLRAHLF